MARSLLLPGTLLALICILGGRHSFAQAQGASSNASENTSADSPNSSATSAEPVVDAPQPRKKAPTAAKKPASPLTDQATPPADNSSPAGTSTSKPGTVREDDETAGDSPGNTGAGSGAPAAKAPAAKDNAFPEDVSRRAAAAQAPSHSAANASARPRSAAGARPGDANLFPEAISRQAEKAARDAEQPAPLPPGVSSSQSSGLVGGSDSRQPAGGTLEVTNPSRAGKDTEVGDFYLLRDDAKGAYLRYQDAIRYDPTNVDAIFGIAEAARMLGKPAEAVRNYQLYLDILPNGPKSKRALKGLQALSQAAQKSSR